MKQENGIVLKNYHEERKKLAILDAERGKIEVAYKDTSPKSNFIAHGAHINYYIEEKNSHYSITQVDIIAMPETLARTNISFLHMVLELCYHFIPFNSRTQAIYDLVSYLFSTPKILSLSAQHMALCRFFCHVGIYPEELPLENEKFEALCHQSLEEILFLKTLDSTEHRMIQSWVLRCIDLHPKKNTFKTFFKLAKNGI